MGKFINYTNGEKVGEFGVVYIQEVKRINLKRRRFLYECPCGTLFESSANHIKTGRTRSCGCYHKTKVTSAEGDTNRNSPFYYIHVAWENMHNRCKYARKELGHSHYEKINISKNWNKYLNFKSYILKVLGPRPTTHHSLDRINNDGNYNPGNLRWATPYQQILNSRLSKLTLKEVKEIKKLLLDKKLTQKEIASLFKVSSATINGINLKKTHHNEICISH